MTASAVVKYRGQMFMRAETRLTAAYASETRFRGAAEWFHTGPEQMPNSQAVC